MKQMELFDDTTIPGHVPEGINLNRGAYTLNSWAECTNISFVFKYRGVPQYLSADEAVSLHSELSQFVEDLEAVKHGRK